MGTSFCFVTCRFQYVHDVQLADRMLDSQHLPTDMWVRGFWRFDHTEQCSTQALEAFHSAFKLHYFRAKKYDGRRVDWLLHVLLEEVAEDAFYSVVQSLHGRLLGKEAPVCWAGVPLARLGVFGVVGCCSGSTCAPDVSVLLTSLSVIAVSHPSAQASSATTRRRRMAWRPCSALQLSPTARCGAGRTGVWHGSRANPARAWSGRCATRTSTGAAATAPWEDRA